MSSLHYQYISLMGNIVTVLRSTDWRISGIQNLKSSLVGPMLDWPKYNLISKEVLRQRLGTVSDLCSRCGDRKNECFCCWPNRNFCISKTASENRLIVCLQVLSQDKLTEAEVAQGGPALLIPDGMGVVAVKLCFNHNTKWVFWFPKFERIV